MDGWISVKNGLPEKGQIVLGYQYCDIATDSPYFILLFLAAENWEVCNDTYPNRSNYKGFIPTHWMKLPEGPKNQ
jgi:hypothetical protein